MRSIQGHPRSSISGYERRMLRNVGYTCITILTFFAEGSNDIVIGNNFLYIIRTKLNIILV